VYGDEKNTFTCISSLSICEDQCYNQYARISHMKFWSFNILALAFVAVIFHFYSVYVNGQVEKLKAEKNDIETAQTEKYNKRTKKIGKIKVKRIYEESSKGLIEIPMTRKIKLAYIISLLARIATETVFIIIGMELYNLNDPNCEENPESFNCPVYKGWLNVMWMTVPIQYICDSPSVRSACSQHRGHPIVCYISSSFEKTVFLRYMQILAVLCWILCVGELVYIILYEFYKRKSNYQQKALKHKNSLDVEKSMNTSMKNISPLEILKMNEISVNSFIENSNNSNEGSLNYGFENDQKYLSSNFPAKNSHLKNKKVENQYI